MVVALLPILGFPKSWESIMQVIIGISIVALTVLISIDKKLSLRAKAQRRQARKIITISTPVANNAPQPQSNPAEIRWSKPNINESSDQSGF